MKTVEWIDSQVKVIDGYISDFNSKIEAARGQVSLWGDEVNELNEQKKVLIQDRRLLDGIGGMKAGAPR